MEIKRNKKKTAPIVLVAIIVLSVFYSVGAEETNGQPIAEFCTCGDICVNPSGWWRAGADFNVSDTPIQSAINNAIAGETICVKDGTYYENVVVNKRLTIKSENGSAYTTVQTTDPNKHVLCVFANRVTIQGFTVKGASGYGKAGIWLSGDSYSNIYYCNISDNDVTGNYYGIRLVYSSNSNLINNTANLNN